MLNEALRLEMALLRFYEHMHRECDYPDVNAFVEDIMERQSKSILRIIGKLNELRATSQTLDGIHASFESL